MSNFLDPFIYVRYFNWNTALIEYYFKNKQKEIMLYADETILEEIGRGIGIDCTDYKQTFYKTVESFCRDYSETYFNKKDKTDVLAVANDICKQSRKLYVASFNENKIYKEDRQQTYELPYLSIVIYIIMKFDEGETQEWKNIKLTTTNSHTFIKSLWKGISDYDNRFDENASVYDRQDARYQDYVGRILYHLPLSSSIRHKIEDAIYKSSAWKVADRISFGELIYHITRSIKNIKKNEELNEILLQCYQKGTYARKVESVIENFDLDSYEDKIEERKHSSHYGNTVTYGNFALALYFPNEPDEYESNIVLLTTIQSPLETQDFCIEKGSSGSLDGYNTMFIRSWANQPIRLRNYSASRRNQYNIEHIVFDDVLFFYKYKYDDCLYIQTDKLIPASEYIIAVKSEKVENFTSWCQEHNNQVTQWPVEDTSELFGDEWRIFFTEDRFDEEYYKILTEERHHTKQSASNRIIMRGGIPYDKSRQTYFINALPYFEVPSQIDITKIKICLNLDGELCTENIDYRRIVSDQRIILDFDGFPFESDEKGYIDLCFAKGNEPISESFSFAICGQRIDYTQDALYKYDNLGLMDGSPTQGYSGNTILHEIGTKNVRCAFNVKATKLNEILPEFYFTNLIAACCYSNPTCEISHDWLSKCINYAANRLDIDPQQEDFISNVKRLMAYAGILSLRYNPNRCQAIPPIFTRAPFSLDRAVQKQLIMLGGCYTRAFIADLLDYCSDKDLNVYTLAREGTNKIEEQLLPPIVLIDHNFDANDFCEEYSHMCDIIYAKDLAIELLNLIPGNSEISKHFDFNEVPEDFMNTLDRPHDYTLPRLRSTRGAFANTRQWFIETADNRFATVPVGMDTWASVFCHRQIKRPMLFVSNRDHYSIHIPNMIWIPSYVQRALYLMNLGLPQIEKAFICNYPSDKYYQVINTYRLHSEDRQRVFKDKFIGNGSDTNELIRTMTPSKHIAELWTSKVNGKKYSDQYLFIYEKKGKELYALVHHKTVFLKYEKQYYKVNSDSLNEVLSFLMKESWTFETGRASVGLGKNGG